MVFATYRIHVHVLVRNDKTTNIVMLQVLASMVPVVTYVAAMQLKISQRHRTCS